MAAPPAQARRARAHGRAFGAAARESNNWGERLTLEWDARALVTVKTRIACGFAPGATTEILAGVLQPAAPGGYQFAVAT